VAARDFTKDKLIMLNPRLGSYLTSCLFLMSSHLVCLILVGNFMTSVEASASSNHSLLMMAERFEMSLKCQLVLLNRRYEFLAPLVFLVSLLFGNSKDSQS
jgi:hypothetical protein